MKGHRDGRWWKHSRAGSRMALALLASAALPVPASSAQVLNTRVIRQEGRFNLHSETLVQAPPEGVRRILTDYENLPRINQALKRVVILEPPEDGGVRMGIVSDFCILGLCLNFVWVQDVHILPDGNIAMRIVPGRGDFEQGKGHWHLSPQGAGTRLIFDVDLKPSFWVPPVFGSWLMKRKLTEEALQTAQGLERRAGRD